MERDPDFAPMKRCSRPSDPPPCDPGRCVDPLRIRTLELLMDQNQLLSDLTEAVRALTSAVLCGRRGH